jgi:hypothetical protein
MSEFEFASDAQMMVVSDRENNNEISLEDMEKQLNTENIIKNLHLNQVVSISE